MGFFALPEFQMAPYAAPPVFVGMAGFFLAVFVLLRERFSRASLLFAASCFSVMLWLVSYAGIYGSANAADALAWVRLEHVGVSFIPAALTLLSFSITGQFHRFRIWCAAIVFLSVGFCMLALFSDLFIDGLIRYPWGYYKHYGPMGFPFLVFFFGSLVLSFVNYWTELHRTESKQRKKRLRWLLISLSIAYLGSIDYLPAYGIPVYPIGFLPAFISMILLARTIWRYRLVDMASALAAGPILRMMPSACLVVDAEGIIQIANPSALAMFGFSEEELIGMPLRKLTELPKEALSLPAAGSPPLSYASEWQRKRGAPIAVSVSACKLTMGRQKSVGSIYIALDMTEQKKAQQELREAHDQLEIRVQERTADLMSANERLKSVTRALRDTSVRLKTMALLDPLTELLNRRGLEEILVREAARARREGTPMLAILVDLDDFKKINDTLGHAVGDLVLKETARCLKTSLRGTDQAGRIGGDEFMVLLPQTRAAEGVQVAEKLRLAIAQTAIVLSEKETVRVTGSLGLINVGTQMASIDKLLADAHRALYQSKFSGKNQVTFDEDPGSPERPRPDRLDETLRELCRDDRYVALAQPILRLSDRREIGVEMLCRSTVASFEMPDDFFRLCMEAKALTLVDHICLKKCLEAAHQLRPELWCHINLFPSTIANTPLTQLLDLFHQIRPDNRFCVEISEQQIIGDPSYLKKPVEALRRAGIRVAMDDVGFGRSCLESLILLEPDIIKIDKRCVQGIDKDGWMERSIKRMGSIAQSLGTEVIAEGIESSEELACIKAAGLHYGQGFLLGKPVPLKKAAVLSSLK